MLVDSKFKPKVLVYKHLDPMVNMLQISSSKNLGGEKLDDIAYIIVDIGSSKNLYEKPQKEKLT